MNILCCSFAYFPYKDYATLVSGGLIIFLYKLPMKLCKHGSNEEFCYPRVAKVTFLSKHPETAA